MTASKPSDFDQVTSMHSHHTPQPGPKRAHQTGVATLLTSVIIMLMATVFIMAISRTSLMELRISGNDIRSRQASNAAEAGLNFGLAYVAQTTQGGVTVPAGADKNSNTIADEPTPTPTALTTGSYTLAFCDPTQPIANISCPDAAGAVVCTRAPPTYFRTPRVVACGWSDDGLGRSMVSQSIGTVPPLSKTPTNPLTAKGAVNVTGSATVTNYYNNLTVWSGGALSNIGNAGKTFVRNPTIPPPAASTAPPPPPASCSSSTDYVCATDKNTTGPDVIDGDPTLSNLTDAELFKNYFGVADIATYQANIASRSAVAAADVGTLAGVKQEAFVVNGDITSSMSFTIGSRDQPVVMIVNGNWSGGGNTTIYGVVYVTGNIDLAGNKTVYGSMVIEGTVSGTGSLDIIYDPLVTDNAANRIGKPGTIPGTWRDWK